MSKNSAKRPHLGRRGSALSLAPLTVERALAAALRVNPADVKKLEAAEAKGKQSRRKGK